MSKSRRISKEDKVAIVKRCLSGEFQYTNRTFYNKLTKAKMKQSMSRVAKCIDNGPMEGFWGILKRERYYGKRFTSREELVQMIENYITYYNNRRIQRSLPDNLNDQSWVGTFHMGHSLYFRFEGIGQSEAIPSTQLAWEANAFEQATTVHTYSSITYENVLPGVDVLYQLNGQQ